MRRLLPKAMLAVGAIALIACASAYALKIEIDKTVVSATASISPARPAGSGRGAGRVASVTRIKTTDGSQPPTLKQLVFVFDKHGSLDTKGLPTCTLAKLADTTPQLARKRCAGAIVGEGIGKAEVRLPGQAPVDISTPLTFFNAPPQGGMPSLIAHAYETIPAPKTLLVPIAIERIQQGRYGFRVDDRAAGDRRRLRRRDPGRSDDRQNLEARRQDGRLRERPLRRRAAAGLRHPDLHRRQLLPRHPDLAMPRRRTDQGRRSLLRPGAAAARPAPPAKARWSIVNDIVLRADGGFQPRALPRQRFAPIDFQGHFDIAAKGGGKPVALEQAVIDFDRDGRLSAGGLPACPPERVAAAEHRRKRAGPAPGRSSAPAASKRSIDLAGGTVHGELAADHLQRPAARRATRRSILHARTTVPATQTFAIVVPIERRPGAFRYRATLALPPIAGGLGAITHVDVKVGRRFSAGGQRRSYVSARCSDGILRTHGRFSFADGTIVDGSVEKACRAR